MSEINAIFSKFATPFYRLADFFKEARPTGSHVDESRQLIKTKSEIRKALSPICGYTDSIYPWGVSHSLI